jgi:hypothetical protein
LGGGVGFGFVLKQDSAVYPRLAWNTLCSPGWHWPLHLPTSAYWAQDDRHVQPHLGIFNFLSHYTPVVGLLPTKFSSLNCRLHHRPSTVLGWHGTNNSLVRYFHGEPHWIHDLITS